MKRNNLNKIEDVVIKLLENNPETRTDDYLLINAFFNEIVDTANVSFKTVCEQHNKLNLPSFESIRRCRAKVQAKRPDLIDPSTAKARKRLIPDYKEYALQ